MCFSIPYKILEVNKDHIVIENGNKLKLPKEPVFKGSYVRVNGSLIDSVLTKEEGESIRTIIKSVYNN